MAESPSHKFGQYIGELLEATIQPELESFANKYSLYLDKKGSRAARGTGKKVSWTDKFNNTHDLDFVLEKNGTERRIGSPVAFIEVAWRRYTKHSRNKAQEIQGAIVPLKETYRDYAPFLGVVLAGEFTDGALNQLRSLGFSVLYFSYEKIIAAFRAISVDASFDESTPDKVFSEKLRGIERLGSSWKDRIIQSLTNLCRQDIDIFIESLKRTITRQIQKVIILPLHGKSYEVATVENAIKFVKEYRSDGISNNSVVLKYEIHVWFNNNDQIQGSFENKERAVEFLEKIRL